MVSSANRKNLQKTVVFVVCITKENVKNLKKELDIRLRTC